MANEYKLSMDKEQFEEVSGAVQFAGTVLPAKEALPAKTVMKKLEHAREFPTLGKYEVILTTKEYHLLESMSDAFKMNLRMGRIIN